MFSTAGVDNPGLVCKSAHAGSIPASASTFESPADNGLRGFLCLQERGNEFRIFGRLPHVGIEGGKPNGVGGYFWGRILNVSFYFASAKLLHRY